MVSGIYFIYHRESIKRYVGQAKNLDKRLQDHWRDLENSKHDNKYLQRAYNKYGRDAFFIVTQQCSIEELTILEQYFLDTMWDSKVLYNICKVANVPPSWKGKKRKPRTAEHSANNSAAQKGKPKPHSAQHILNRSAARKGIPMSSEQKAKISAANRHPAWQFADEIRAERATGKLFKEIAVMYECGIGTVQRICSA